MCGIALALGLEDLDASVRSMLARMWYRGAPNCQNEVESVGPAVLGTNRLPITSDITSRQPASSPDGRYHFAYNGEVYGLALADSGGDTMAIALLLQSQGVSSVTRLNGMYALAIVDRVAGMAYLVRDRFGIKPLYYCQDGDRFLAASEAGALLAATRDVCIETLAPGELLEVPLDNPAYRRSIDKSDPADPARPITDIEMADPVGAVRAALVKAVGSCLASIPPGAFGVFLSGGVDSAAVYQIARRLRPDVVAVIGGAPGMPDHDAAMRLVASVGGEAIVASIPPESALFDRAADIVAIAESYEPNLVRQSAVFEVFCAAAAKAGLRVMLCGEGADELFCGYPDFQQSVPHKDWRQLRAELLRDLHRTQLQRVDRFAMRRTIEVRVPFLDSDLSSLALSLPAAYLFEQTPDRSRNKLVLREALEGILPDDVRLRPKVVLSEGCGLGGNHPTQGMFYRLASDAIGRRATDELVAAYPDWTIATPEEAFYFRAFAASGLTQLKASKARTTTNRVSSIDQGGPTC